MADEEDFKEPPPKGQYTGTVDVNNLVATEGTYTDVFGQDWNITKRPLAGPATNPAAQAMQALLVEWDARIAHVPNLYGIKSTDTIIVASDQSGNANVVASVDNYVDEWKKEHDKAKAEGKGLAVLALIVIVALVMSDQK